MKPAQLVHFGIYCRDIEKLTAFYMDLFGLKKTDQGQITSGGICFLTSDPKEHHQLVLIEGRNPDQKSTVQQISFRLGKFSDLREMKEKLDKMGIAARPIDHGCAWSFYIADPEGNGIEIYVDSPWMIDQPYGVLMDWSKSDAELLKITEDMCRKEPSFAPRVEWEKRNARQFA